MRAARFAIAALLGACTGSISLPGVHTTTPAAATPAGTTPAGTTPAAASASQDEPTNDPHLGRQPMPAGDPVDPVDGKDLDQLEGMKLDDAKAMVRSWSRDVRIDVMVVDDEYSKRRDASVRCYEGVVCEAHRDNSFADHPVVLEVGPKPDVGAAPPPP